MAKAFARYRTMSFITGTTLLILCVTLLLHTVALSFWKSIHIFVDVVGIGHGIDLFAMLCLHQLEDGRFGVYHDPEGKPDDIQEWLFDEAEPAVDFFIAKRKELSLGYDFESEDGSTEFYRRKARGENPV